MLKKYILFLFVTSLFLFSCEKEEGIDLSRTVYKNKITKNWELTSYEVNSKEMFDSRNFYTTTIQFYLPNTTTRHLIFLGCKDCDSLFLSGNQIIFDLNWDYTSDFSLYTNEAIETGRNPFSYKLKDDTSYNTDWRITRLSNRVLKINNLLNENRKEDIDIEFESY